jgi:hypothetical protein
LNNVIVIGDSAVVGNQDDLAVIGKAGTKLAVGRSTATEALHLEGAVIVGNAVGTTNGTIRYTGTDVEARIADAWVSLTAGDGGSSTDSIVFEAPITLVEGAGSDPDTVRLDTTNFVTGNLNIIGGQQVKRTLVTSNTTLTYNHFYIAVDASGGNVTVTLPAISGRNQAYRIKRIDNSGNTVTISAGSGQTIDGAASTTLTSLQSKYVIADGSTNYELN